MRPDPARTLPQRLASPHAQRTTPRATPPAALGFIVGGVIALALWLTVIAICALL